MIEGADLLNVPIVEIEKRLFQMRDFDFITITDRGQNKKQDDCLHALLSGEYREILYGGAAGGAKSWTGCVWLTFMAECHAGTRWFVGREELKRLRESTFITFQKVFRAYGIEGVKYNDRDHFLLFSNGSRIDFLELKYYPSDPLYERFGSVEYTGGWIEEAGEMNFGAFDVLKSRIGRHMNDHYRIPPVLFLTCNPKKNWLYYEFYTPWKVKTMQPHRLFIQAFVQDNPATESSYLAQLQSLQDKVKRERLLLGNWDYDDDPALLVDFDAICDLFTNDHILPGENKAISADLALKGRDRFIGGLWETMVCTVAIDKPIATGKSVEQDLKALMIRGHVPRSRTVVDGDGLGAYLDSYLTGIKVFHAGAQAFDNVTFANLKSECAYKLAEFTNKRQMKIVCNEEQKDKIIMEMGALKAADVDKDEARKRIISKKDMKEIVGHSPDYLDMLIMKMFLHVKPRSAYGIAV